ncbi:MAG: hypothetical protein AAF959_12950 [Cyanobacteria bacterium P01_D01_bin.56]
MTISIEKRLEQYTIAHPKEVLLISAKVNGEPDEIMIFRGFSSSLMRSTSFDPDIPVLPDTAEIITVDRLAGPYNSASPQYIEQRISWEMFSKRLG